ncbi:MAG: hypothetical protein DHS80DRAFT_9436, partial [Piptocephalis tieghemiana]
GFPEEACTPESFSTILHEAPNLALGAYYTPLPSPRDPHPEPRIVGLIVGTCAHGSRITSRAMDEHDPSGDLVCLRCVCVAPGWRGRGVAQAMLHEYIDRVRKAKRAGAIYRSIALYTHAELVGFYAKVGFKALGRSSVVIGLREWYDME